MFIWFMIKPIMHLCIKDLIKKCFKISSRLQIESPKDFKIQMLIISWPWALFGSEFLIIWKMCFTEKLQLANEFSVSKANCDSNTLCSAKKKSAMHLLKTLLLQSNYS